MYIFIKNSIKFNLTFLFFLNTLITVSQSIPVVTTGLNGPIDVVIEGDIAYVNEFFGNSVSRVNLSTTPPIIEEVVTGLTLPNSVLFSNNQLYISESTGVITRRNASDFSATPEVITNTLNDPIHMIIDGTDLYVSEFGSSARIVKIDLANGNTIETIVSEINVPRQMALVGSNLYVAESGADNILRIDLTEINPTAQVIFSGLLNPAGLYAIGNIIYITEDIDDTGKLLRFDSSLSTPSLETVAINLDGPHGISSYENDIYIIEQRIDQLSKIDNILSVNENIISENDFSISPNPNNGIFNIRSSQYPIQKMTINDMLGRQVFTNEINTVSYRFESQLDAGSYFLVLNTEKNSITKKIIIK